MKRRITKSKKKAKKPTKKPAGKPQMTDWPTVNAALQAERSSILSVLQAKLDTIPKSQRQFKSGFVAAKQEIENEWARLGHKVQ